MKRGRPAVSTIGSRTVTSELAWPTASLVQATTMTRTVPLNMAGNLVMLLISLMMQRRRHYLERIAFEGKARRVTDLRGK